MQGYILIVIGVSLLSSAFFSGMEMAFVSSNKLKIELDKKLGFFSAKVMSYFSKNQAKFISAMLVGNNISLVIYGFFMAFFLEPMFLNLTDSSFTVFLLQTVVSTLLILVTAEFLPKAIFRINPNNILNVFAVPVAIIYVMLFPIVYITMFLSNVVLNNIFKVETKESDLSFGMVDLDNYLKEEALKIDYESQVETEIQIFQKALDFSKVKARECMVPRTEIIAIEENAAIEELNLKFIDTGYSKIMIYRETIDNIIGYIHSFEMFKSPNEIKSVILPISVIPESMPANEILEFFIAEKKSIAIVLDEFGGTSGMVTLEDIVEELFGDIEDEHDSDGQIEKEINPNEYVFSARLEVDYLKEKYKLNLPESDEFETLAGLIIHAFESIPKRNEVIAIKGFRFTIRAVSNNRIDIVHLQKLPQGEE